MNTPTLFELPTRHRLVPPDPNWQAPPLAVDAPVNRALAHQCAVAFGISGGKDGSVAAYQTLQYLDQIGHTGSRLLVHSDLGRIEWADSLPNCERLARHLSLDLLIVRRQKGDMIDRWEERWRRSVERYQSLSCVRLIMPWSSAQNRFCTSELKSSVIASGLVTALPGQFILSVAGIRADESTKRAKRPISSPNERLLRKGAGTDGMDWNPILNYSLADIWQTHHRAGLPLHEAYTQYGNSRVSCCFCVLGVADWETSINCPGNHDAYRALVDLEIRSAFGFTEQRWLGDLSPRLLSDAQRRDLGEAKRRAIARQRLEAAIPPGLLYVEGWPRRLPTDREAVYLGQLREQVAQLGQFTPMITDPAQIMARYELLMTTGHQKKARQTEQEARKIARASRVVH